MSFAKTVPFILIALLFIQCNENKTNKNLLNAPENWRGEVIEFPLEFAPSLQYSGIEYVRFAPGWGKEGNLDYFSYVFAWDLYNDPQLSTGKLESDIETYFDGLMSVVSGENQNSVPSFSRSKAFFEKVNDSVYIGKVLTHDAFTSKKAVSLNILVNYSFCKQQNNHFVVFMISPQGPEHQIWKTLKKINLEQDCLN
ncbi:hypothetical protein [Aquimarina sediminis]|uniref:hypothetical protein n=1 Tax=Aquimarina sediminis TaxID=2070536 RepID=UPI000CA08F37|nr:hypothetical protein [Aquimarina sediminis]